MTGLGPVQGLVVPVRHYQVRLIHRLLAELGPLSHLLLETAAQGTAAVAWVGEVTGLSAAQLHPLTHRLTGLGLFDAGMRLTAQGEAAATGLRCLHDQPRQLWLDSDYDRVTFVGTAQLEPALLDEGQVCLLQRPGGNQWPLRSRLEDCERQRQRIERHAAFYLGAAFDSYLLCMRGTRLGTEWTIQVAPVDASMSAGPARVVPVAIDPQWLDSNPRGHALMAPVLRMRTEHALPAGLVALDVQRPDDVVRLATCVADMRESELLDDPGQVPQWPPRDEQLHELMSDVLIADVAGQTHAGHGLFNRQHHLQPQWCKVFLDRARVAEALAGTRGVLVPEGSG